jgi:BirA family transcriptional regulator, biotin operon repressor / biotin---[acetyl-CoA-carboxylase] ligase
MNRNAAAILNLLKESGGYLSGGGLSKTLGVSRTAVWKQIVGLRGAGYQIEAVPSLGYRLVNRPDILSEAEIRAVMQNGLIGSRLVIEQETVSTNIDAFRLAEAGAQEGTVVIADRQTSGKGRLGRQWVSPGGVNLYCSVVLRPPLMPYEAPQLTFLSAVAVAKAIEITTDLKPTIKWPNDILLDGSKVAGLLNEMSAETDRVGFVILGIGVNLNMSQEQFPDDLRHPATSVAIRRGSPVARIRFVAVLLAELDRAYTDFLAGGFKVLREEWERRCNAYGRQVQVDMGSSRLEGAFAGIDQDGAMLVRLPDGRQERILSGDVRVL